MGKQNSISKFANSLTEFLINAMADKYADAKHYAYRYNNLKVYMDPQKTPEPHFYVSLGISEAGFGIEDGKKIEGSLGSEDGLVTRWASRTNIYNELKNHWKTMMDAIAAEMDDDTAKKTDALVKLRRAEKEETDLTVDMTGTGIDKQKRTNLTKRINAPKLIDDMGDDGKMKR